jgi:hypothetical protein
MYNPATQVQVPTDANLGSYFQKTKIVVGASPTAFPFKKKVCVPDVTLPFIYLERTALEKTLQTSR